MKKILEIYDISNDYNDYQGNPYIVVLNPQFEADKNTVKNILNSQYTVLTSNEWNNYKNTITTFNNNDAKHRMRKEKPIEYSSSNKLMKINSEEINFDGNSNISKAINMLSPQPKSRFIKYYIDGKTYKEIAFRRKWVTKSMLNKPNKVIEYIVTKIRCLF